VPVGKGSDEQKQTNEIKIAAPLLSCVDIETKQPPAKAGGFKLSAESTDTGLKPVL